MICFLSLFISSNSLEELNITRHPSTNAPPSQRLYGVADYSVSLNVLVFFGGSQSIDTFYNDVWIFNLETLLYEVLVPTNENYPCIDYTVKRINLGGFVDDNEDKLYIFGGLTSNGPQEDLWSFDLVDLIWTREDTTGESPTSRYRIGYTKYTLNGNTKFAVFGGSLANGESDDCYM